jgi:hypothetical protein
VPKGIKAIQRISEWKMLLWQWILKRATWPWIGISRT